MDNAVTDNAQVEHPELNGRRFSLVPVAPQHHQPLYNLSVSQFINFRWRYHGLVPTFEMFERTLFTNVLVQFVLVPNNDPRAVAGLAVAYNANLQDGWSYVATMSDPRAGAGSIEGVALLIRYLFSQWPLRKVYFEAPAFNVSQFGSGVRSGLMREEARLKEHRYYDGRYWDDITYAMYREDAAAFVEHNPTLFRAQPVDEGPALR
jgi:hypothetical protein